MRTKTQSHAVNLELTARVLANGKTQANRPAQTKRGNTEAIIAISILSVLVAAVLLACHFGLINASI